MFRRFGEAGPAESVSSASQIRIDNPAFSSAPLAVEDVAAGLMREAVQSCTSLVCVSTERIFDEARIFDRSWHFITGKRKPAMAMSRIGEARNDASKLEDLMSDQGAEQEPRKSADASPMRSAFDALPHDVFRYFAHFVDPLALVRLASTSKRMRKTLGPDAPQYALLDRCRKVSSLQSFKELLAHDATVAKVFTLNGKLQPFRAALVATLGSRILALPSHERDEARKAFIAAAEQCPEPRPPALKNALSAAKEGLVRLQSDEHAAVTSSLLTCETCQDLTAVQELAAERGVCSEEGFDRMKLAAARAALSKGLSSQQACDRFDIPHDKRETLWAESGYDDDFGIGWSGEFFE
jgi:hypothetical protein